MAITKTQLESIGFTKIRNSSHLVRAVGNDLVLSAVGSHIYINGSHLINTEFMDLEFVTKYLEAVIQGRRKLEKQHVDKEE